MKFAKALTCLAVAALPTTLFADNARFDLVGPKIDVRVTRGGRTLPIAEVPNLQPGDKLWVKADLPDSQSNHLLLIVAFLRGTTNEPPDNWFTEIDTWEKKHKAEGTTVTVPAEAEQALLFVAPETGGDFRTLRSAVKGKPGLFIRADADLNEASFEQQRIERYLAAMKTVPQGDPKAIQDHSAKLAATLALKPNADCFKQPVEAQVNCLTQSSAPVLMDDGHGQSVAMALSTGASSDFINAASTTGAAGGGLYSAYVGAVVDLVHLVSTLHTAKYQYIPGLSFPEGDALQLKLNAPPSFHDPKSVIVIGLPAIQQVKLPPLHAHDAKEVACLLQPKMALPLEGAPLVFSTSFAHDLVLHLNRTDATADIPLKPDAFEGGLVVTKSDARQPLQDNAHSKQSNARAGKPAAQTASASDLLVTGTVRGYWGFDPFEGPTLTLQQVDGKDFKIVGDTQLLAGQENHLRLQGDGTACVQHIALTNSDDNDIDVGFKPDASSEAKPAHTPLALDVSLKKVRPGGYSLAIQQYGDAQADKVPLTAYNGDIHLSALKIHSGDDVAILNGTGLDSVAGVQLSNQTFVPDPGADNEGGLRLKAKAGVSPENGSEAAVKLKDGRTMTVKVDAEASRPNLTLTSMRATATTAPGTLPITLAGKDEIPLDGKLTLVLQSKEPLPRDQKLELATTDGALKTTLSLAGNSLILQDPHTAIATLEPLKAFGQSAFGALQMRPVAADGTAGDWTPLGVLVRTPAITALHCEAAGAPTCSLDGSNLFLVQSFAATQDFSQPAEVPNGFSQGSIPVPAPANGTLYLKLRDDPKAIASVAVPLSPAGSPVPVGTAASTTAPAPTPGPVGAQSPAPTSAPTSPTSADPAPGAAPTQPGVQTPAATSTKPQ